MKRDDLIKHNKELIEGNLQLTETLERKDLYIKMLLGLVNALLWEREQK